MILVDGNVLVHFRNRYSPQQATAQAALQLLHTRDGETIVTCAQTLYEAYVVWSRPRESRGLGLTAQQTLDEISRLGSQFALQPALAKLYTRWLEITRRCAPLARHAHDLRYVAFMVARRIPRLLTFNDRRFREVTEVAAVNPNEAAGTPRP